MTAVTHFEIYAEKPEGLADFYRSLFGWQLDKSPGLDYWHIKSDATDAKRHQRRFDVPPVPWTTQLGALRPRRVARCGCRRTCSVSAERCCARRPPCRRPPGMRWFPTPRATSSPSGSRTRPHFHRRSRTDAETSVADGRETRSKNARAHTHPRGEDRCTTPTTRYCRRTWRR